jgi:DNA-binding beta-propeller fold protein YncE
MARPYALLRAGFPYLKTIGMRRNVNHPVDIALGKEGRVYVLCSMEISPNTGVAKITLDDDYLGHIGGVGKEDGKFIWPISIVVDRDETLVISDSALHRITFMRPDGEFLGKWGEHGSRDGQLDRPAGLAFDADEDLYVVDTMNHRVQKFTREGKFLMNWGSYGDGEGQFDMPWGITIDELGDVYVVDWRNDRVQKFTADGEFVFALGESGDGEGEFNRPAGVAVDSDGDIYVADTGNNRVQLFSEEGRYVEQFIGDATLSKSMINYMMVQGTSLMLREHSRLEPQKRFRTPRSVVVDDQKRMYVAEFHSFRVQIYEKQAIPLGADQIAPRVTSRKLKTI